MTDIHRSFRVVLAVCSIAAVFVTTARAADESPWSNSDRSTVRLIAGANSKSDVALRAGVEIKLQPGWKTYWRYPGDSGVPPHFDFSGSENLKAARVHYPAPHLFTDETGHSLGYKNGTIFPLEIMPERPGQPVNLHMKIDYAVCEKLCVPAEGSAQLTLAPGGKSAHDAALAAAEALVPTTLPAAQIGLTARRVNNAAKPLVAVDFKAPAGQAAQLFVEGPTPEWALPIPEPTQGAPPGRAQFGFQLDGLPPGVDPKGNFELTFTIISGERAFEVKTHLD